MYMIKNFLSEALDQSCCIILRTRSFFKKKIICYSICIRFIFLKKKSSLTLATQVGLGRGRTWLDFATGQIQLSLLACGQILMPNRIWQVVGSD